MTRARIHKEGRLFCFSLAIVRIDQQAGLADDQQGSYQEMSKLGEHAFIF